MARFGQARFVLAPYCLILSCLILLAGCLPTATGRTLSSQHQAAPAPTPSEQAVVSLGEDWPWNGCDQDAPAADPVSDPLGRAACLAATLASSLGTTSASTPASTPASSGREPGDGREAEQARQGLDLALEALAHDPDDPDACRAHYLAAWFLYRLADGAGWSDQAMVRDLENHALAAAQGCPTLDGGGPLRLLGRVDLDSPRKPAGLGDVAQAEEHYRAALTLAPGRLENRLGLAEALLAKGDTPLACLEIQELVAAMPPREDLLPAWRRTLELLRGLCFLHSR